jgi:hypothetical protein
MPFPILNGAVIAASLLGGAESPRPQRPQPDRLTPEQLREFARLPTPEQLKAELFDELVGPLREALDKTREVRMHFEKRTDGDYSDVIAELKRWERIFEEMIVEYGGTVKPEKKEGEKK